MQTYEIIVSGRAVRANSADTTLVRTSVGIDKIHVLFDNVEWTNFPVRVTFANGETLVSTSVTLTALESTEWAAEAECTIPWEVIQTLGGIRITFQGTDSSGKHIITEASGTPLTVVEAGDVVDGSAPQPDPTVDEWHQAYADAMAAASDAASAAERVAEILHSTDAQTLEELIAALGSAIRYKGSVATYADLPDDAEPGDMYNVAAAYGDYPAGTNWAWTTDGAWDALGGEIDLSIFAPLASPALTGTPTAPTAASGTDTTQIATTAFVQQEIGAQDAATTTADGLMSSADKTKLDGIEAQANKVTAGDGLTLSDGSLSLGPLVGEGNPTRGCALYEVNAQGWSEQRVTVGKNLAHGADKISPWPSTQQGQLKIYDATTDAALPFGALCFSIIANPVKFTENNASIFVVNRQSGTSYISKNKLGLAANTNNVGVFSVTTQNAESDPITSITVPYYTDSWAKFDASSVMSIQLEAGSTATDYEPYTGGAPSPSPDYPQEIQVARGRNLLQVENGTYDTDYVTKLDNSARVRCMNPIPVKADETYALTLASDTGKTVQCVRAWLDASMSEIETSGWNTTTSVTPPANAAYVVAIFRYSDQSAINASDVKLQFELGSTPTPYVPYGHVGLEVQGKNLIDGDGLVDSSAWKQLYYQLEPNTQYTLSTNKPSSSDALFNLLAQGTTGTGVKYPSNGNPIIFTTDATALVRIDYRNSGTDKITNYWYQLEKGALTEYEPYHHETRAIPLPLKSDGERWAGGLPDGTADALSVDSAGRYVWECPTDEAVLDGSTIKFTNRLEGTIGNSGVSDRFACTNQSFDILAPPSGTQLNGICSHGTPSGSTFGSNIWSIGNFALYQSKTIFLVLASQTLESANAWLAAHPVTVLYPLAVPTTEEGYIDLPDLPDGAVVDIPELTELGVSWWVKGADAVVEHAANMARRNEEIEDAIAELAARVAALES